MAPGPPADPPIATQQLEDGSRPPGRSADRDVCEVPTDDRGVVGFIERIRAVGCIPRERRHRFAEGLSELGPFIRVLGFWIDRHDPDAMRSDRLSHSISMLFRCDDEERNPPPRAQHIDQLPACKRGKVEVENHDVRMVPGSEINNFPAVVRLTDHRDFACFFEHLAEHRTHSDRAVADHGAGRAHCPPPTRYTRATSSRASSPCFVR